MSFMDSEERMLAGGLVKPSRRIFQKINAKKNLDSKETKLDDFNQPG